MKKDKPIRKKELLILRQKGKMNEKEQKFNITTVFLK